MSSRHTAHRPPGLLGPLPAWLRSVVAWAVAILALAALGYVLVRVLSLVTPLVLAVAATLLLAAMVMPLVDLLARARIPRGLAALFTVLLLLAVIGLIGAIFGIGFSREVDNLTSTITTGVDRIRDWLVNGPPNLDPAQVDRLSGQAGERLRDALPGAVRGVTTVAETLAMAALAMVLLFFLLKDGPSIGRWMLGGTPARHRDRTRAAAVAGWETLQGYVRGTAVIAATDAAGIGIGLFVLGVPLALPLALVTFVASFVPVVGATVAGALAVLVALATKGPVTALLTLGVVLLVQNLEGNLLQPLIMGRTVRLHPAVILVAVAAGALVAGIGGALLATPLTAVCHRVVLALRSHPEADSDGSPNGQDTNGQDTNGQDTNDEDAPPTRVTPADDSAGRGP